MRRTVLRRPGRSEPPELTEAFGRGLMARALALFTTAALVCLAGCGGMSIRGSAARSEDGGFFGWHFYAPFDTSEVKTVFVSFKTQTFRRDLEKQLTEAVLKEITLRTPYKIVGNPKEADSILKGMITFGDKNLVVEAPTNFPRELSAMMTVQVNWTHNPPNEVEKTRLPTVVTETINFVPEVGETTLTAFNHVIQSIAKQIVDMMEQPWFNEKDLE
jgi:Lipopolysaccharide-assembly